MLSNLRNTLIQYVDSKGGLTKTITPKPLTYYHHSRYFSWILGMAILSISLIPKLTHFISADSALYLELAYKMLTGKSYYEDFFEFNTPMAIASYIPPVALAKSLGLNAITVSILYTQLLCIASIGLIHCFIHEDKGLGKPLYYNSLVLSLFVVFSYPLPVLWFNGLTTKSIIFCCCFTPYIFASYRYIQHRQYDKFDILCGLFLGIALCLKPHYVIFPLCIELYVSYKTKSLFSWWRSHNIIALLVLAFYSFLLIFIFPNYLFKNLPLAFVFYPGTQYSIGNVLSSVASILISNIIAFALVIALWKHIKRLHGAKIIFIPTIASYLVLSSEGLISYDQTSLPFFFFWLFLLYSLTSYVFNKESWDMLSRKAKVILFFCAFITIISIAEYGPHIFSLEKRNREKTTASLIAHAKNKEVLVLSDNTQHAYPMLNMVNQESRKRLPILVVLWGLEKYRFHMGEHEDIEKMITLQQAEEYVTDAIKSALSNNPPDIVFTNKIATAHYYLPVCMHNILEHILQKDEEVAKLWRQNYRKTGDIKTFYNENKPTRIYTTTVEFGKSKKKLKSDNQYFMQDWVEVYTRITH